MPLYDDYHVGVYYWSDLDEDWKSLYKLSEQTFVEETDSLKQSAAGAGLTDND